MNKDQGSAKAPRIVESRLCLGCNRPCGDEEYCRDCDGEAAAWDAEDMERWYAATSAASRFRTVMFWTNVVGLFAAVVYLVGAYGYAFLEWILEGGVR